MFHPISTAEGAGGFRASVIEYSAHPAKAGKPLITMSLRYPRFIHAEFMTHRVFSRNASSSRAIPVAKVLEQVRNEPAMPIHWGKNQPGMQAREECNALIEVPVTGQYAEEQSTFFVGDARETWTLAAHAAADIAEAMSKAGYHKQVVNRLLEPFQFMNVVVTATDWDNFFELRDHEDAEPNIQHLARLMKQAIQTATPTVLNYGEWHLPYVTKQERGIYNLDSCRRMSAARCARVSYLTHEGSDPDPAKDFDLFDRLVGSVPLHASPIEHQATPDAFEPTGYFASKPGFAHPELWGNFQTWVQFRKVWEQQIKESK